MFQVLEYNYHDLDTTSFHISLPYCENEEKYMFLKLFVNSSIILFTAKIDTLSNHSETEYV